MTEAVHTPAGPHSNGVRAALDALVSTPVRQFQTLGIATFAVTAWMFIAMRTFRSVLPRGSVEAAMADATAGGTGERWYSFYLTILAWGHLPAFFLIVLVGTALAIHTLIRTAREPLDALGMESEDRDQYAYVPAGFFFFGAVVMGGLTFNASALVSLTPGALFWDHSVAQWAALGWWALALVTAVGALVRAMRRRSVRRRWEGTVEARMAAKERNAILDRQMSFQQALGAQRAGRGEFFNDAERERVGAGASGWAIIALFSGMLGLGPVGLIAGAAALRGQRMSMWVGTLGMALSAVQTTVIIAALVLAVATG